MLWNRNNYFKRSPKWDRVETLLFYKGIDKEQFEEAFNYFLLNPNNFDGASFVKDLDDLPDLDLSAMVHDYDYLVKLPKLHSWSWLFAKFKTDFQYAKNMERFGKGIWTPYVRFVGLVLSTPFYLGYLKLTQ